MNFITELTASYSQNASPEKAGPMEKYMKNNFVYHGLKTELRRSLQKAALEKHKDEVKNNAREIALALYGKKEREFHYSAIEILMIELKKKFVKQDIDLIEKILVTHPWWDSVDTISKYLLGGYLEQFPEEKYEVIERFSASENMWLNRAAIIFQLGYKKATNESLLFSECEKHCQSKEFFIQKAIGWALREYAKTNPEAVKNFVASASLKPLSSREALKNL
ncbi:DNA alkylation repair protein [Flavobacterium sp. MFBS3-15]|uniref:DNA alkylation repair protein n=1 Tax=Flavobacterium sp. MFBS3-15 TaxID=2989816 RepID=UPI002235AD79|nr:DNA alkylation repair protein [Flavobacterium sp. MFBS3-15]MCW4470897.1 DNA alkylation repair protein [Flavobacterium sp. MFBS3-15]